MSANTLIDVTCRKLGCKNDAAFARVMNVAPAVISKMRHGHLSVGATFILTLHELDPDQFPVKFIRDLLAEDDAEAMHA